MTSPDPANLQTADDIQAEIRRIDEERAELLRQARDLRESLNDAGPIDAEDRAATITQAEELEAFAEELQRRRDSLRARLGESP
jgi:erythromycin esterase-like protein